MEATIGGLTRDVVVAKPLDLAEARQYLQDAIRNADAYNGFAPLSCR